MRLLISLILLFSFSPYVGALTSLDRAELSFPNSLQDSNPGFESGTVKWSGSGGTFTINNTAADQFIAGSKQFAVWDSDGAAQERCSALVKVPESGNCAVSLTYRVPSGTATHKIVAKDGSKDLAVEDVFSSTAAWRHDVEFPCASAASNQARVCLRSVAANEPAIQLDGGYAGEARQVSKCGVDTPWVSYTPSLTTSGGGAITLNATSKTDPFGRWRQVGDSIEIEVGFKNGSGGAATGTAGTMQFSIPSGASIDSSKAVSTSAFAFTVGTGDVYPLSSNFSPSSAVLYNGGILQLIKAGTALSFQVSDIVAGFEVRMRAKYPVVGWAASQCVTPNQQGWFASGFISGANPNLGNTAVSTYAEIANGSLSLTANTGSASVGIACSSTNASTVGSSTCSAGNEVVGITTNIPRSGVYEACFQFGHVINIGGSPGGSLTAAFQIVETANSSGTVTQEANGRITSGAGYEGGSNSPNQVNPVMVCGTLSLSAGQRLIKVYYEQSIPSGTIFTNEIQADASAAVGQRNVYFIVRPVNSQQQAILANSVSTQVANGARMIWASVKSVCSASPCTIGAQSGDFTSITRSGTGAYQANFNAGTFSGTPVCTCSTGGSLDGHCSAYSSTTLNSTVRTYTPAGASQDGYIEMMCIGPR